MLSRVLFNINCMVVLIQHPRPHLLSRGPDRDVDATPLHPLPCLKAPLVGLVTPSTLVRVLRVVTMPACMNNSLLVNSTPSSL